MKKILSLTLIALLLFSLFSCNTEEANEGESQTYESSSTLDTSSSDIETDAPEYGDCDLPYSSFDLEEFLQNVTTASGISAGKVNTDKTATESVPIPKSLTDEFNFYIAHEYSGQFIIYFRNSNSDDPFFSSIDGIVVYVQKDANGFEKDVSTLTDRFSYGFKENLDGSLCKESINRIDVNVDGRRVGFDFPDNNFEKIDTMEKLYKYFKFEKRQISTGEKAE